MTRIGTLAILFGIARVLSAGGGLTVVGAPRAADPTGPDLAGPGLGWADGAIGGTPL
jgi:hypothetical protein